MTPGVLGSAVVVAAAAAWVMARRWIDRGRAMARIGPPAPPATRVPARLARWIADTGVDGDPAVLVRGWLTALAVGVVAAAVTPAGAVLLGVAAVGPPIALVVHRGRADRRRTAQLPVALDAVAAGVRGGASLRGALRDAAARTDPPLGPELAALARRAESGMSLAEVVGEWTDERGDGAARLAGASLVVAATLGGPGADALEGAAASLRERAGLEADASALSVQARLSAAVLSAAPIGFALLLSSIDPASGRFLLATPIGWACIAGGLALDAAGAAWMARIVRGAR